MMSTLAALALVASTAHGQFGHPTWGGAVSQAGRGEDTWAKTTELYVGVRGGLAIPPGATALAPNAALEVGVAVPKGFGFGLRLLGMGNPPAVPLLGVSAATYGFGAMVDLRYYIEAYKPVSIYPAVGLGFLAGPEVRSGTNLVMPLLNTGVGVRGKLGNFYGALEIGVAAFTIPYLSLTVGFETERPPGAPSAVQEAPAPPSTSPAAPPSPAFFRPGP